LKTIQSVLSSENLENVLEILVIDDASTDGTSESIRKSFPNTQIRVVQCKQENLTSECRNIGLKEAQGEYVFFLDDDVIISPQAIFQLRAILSLHKNVACVMPLIMYYTNPNLIWCAGIHHNFWTTHGFFFGYNEVDNGQFKFPIISDSVITAFMVRKTIAAEIRFDSKTFPIGWEDFNFAMDLKAAGFFVYMLPWVKVWHDFPTARFVKNRLRLYFEVRNRIIFHKKWSANTLQRFFSVTMSVATGLTYLILGLIYVRSFKSVKIAFLALVDGLLSRRHDPLNI
jgi:GT2 family glycosyltransferase